VDEDIVPFGVQRVAPQTSSASSNVLEKRSTKSLHDLIIPPFQHAVEAPRLRPRHIPSAFLFVVNCAECVLRKGGEEEKVWYLYVLRKGERR
jgi:hypothetical protein